MKKTLLSLSIISAITLALTGCVYQVVPGAPVSNAPAEDPTSPQPKFKYEQYTSYALDEAMRKAVLDIKRQMPALYRENRSFVVGSFADGNDLNRSAALGRAMGASLTKAAGKTARAQHVRYNNAMLIPTTQGYLQLNTDATDLAQRLKATALFVGTYRINQGTIDVSINVIRASDNQSLVQHSFSLPMDQNLYTISRTY